MHSCATGRGEEPAAVVPTTAMGPAARRRVPPRLGRTARRLGSANGAAFAISDAGVAASSSTPPGGTETAYDPGRDAMASLSRGRDGVSSRPVNLIVAPMRTALPTFPNALTNTKCDEEDGSSSSAPPDRHVTSMNVRLFPRVCRRVTTPSPVLSSPNTSSGSASTGEGVGSPLASATEDADEYRLNEAKRNRRTFAARGPDAAILARNAVAAPRAMTDADMASTSGYAAQGLGGTG